MRWFKKPTPGVRFIYTQEGYTVSSADLGEGARVFVAWCPKDLVRPEDTAGWVVVTHTGRVFLGIRETVGEAQAVCEEHMRKANG